MHSVGPECSDGKKRILLLGRKALRSIGVSGREWAFFVHG